MIKVNNQETKFKIDKIHKILKNIQKYLLIFINVLNNIHNIYILTKKI